MAEITFKKGHEIIDRYHLGEYRKTFICPKCKSDDIVIINWSHIRCCSCDWESDEEEDISCISLLPYAYKYSDENSREYREYLDNVAK